MAVLGSRSEGDFVKGAARILLEVDAHGFPVMLSSEPVAPPVDTSYTEARRRDAVRAAAREFETMSAQDLRERFAGVVEGELDDEDLGDLVLEVRQAQLDDLVDILDDLRVGRKRARRHVRIATPKGYLRKTLWALTPGEYAELKVRLAGRGWSTEDLTTSLDKRLSDKKLKDLQPHGVLKEES